MDIDIKNARLNLTGDVFDQHQDSFSDLIIADIVFRDGYRDICINCSPLIEFAEILQRLLFRVILTKNPQLSLLWDTGEEIGLSPFDDGLRFQPVVGGSEFIVSYKDMLNVIMCMNTNIMHAVESLFKERRSVNDVITDEFSKYIIQELRWITRASRKAE